MTLVQRPTNYAPLQTLVSTELTLVKAAATTWAGSISTLIALGGVFGLTVVDKTVGPLASSGLLGRAVVFVVLLVYGAGVVLAQLAAQGRLRRGTVGEDPAQVQFQDTVAAINSTRMFLRYSRWCIGLAALASWLVLMFSVATLGNTKPAAYLITAPNAAARCTSALKTYGGRLTLGGQPLPAGVTLTAVSSCPASLYPAAGGKSN